MYKAFFNLRKKPFELVPDPEFMYLSRSHKKALTYLDYGIRERAGFILLTGDVGSGKTTLIQNLLSKRYERVTLAKVFNTRVTSEQLLAMINDDFGLSVAGKDKVTLIRDLNDFLLEQYAAGNHPILIIDEAQNLAADLLEEIRMLSNLESSTSKLLQIVLVGQPELRETLAAPELLQLRQRISINCHLKALSRQETAEYVVHRMTIAGDSGALEFPEETLDLVFHYSRGIPRLTNIICDFLMLSAFAEEVRCVSLEMAHDVIGDLDFENHFWGGSPVQSPERRSAGRASEEDPRGAAVEAGAVEQIAGALKEINTVLADLKEQVRAHQGKNDVQVADLTRKLAQVSAVMEKTSLNPVLRPSDVGFMRRLLGSSAAGGK
jgi:putative secretion ATPase (PEP-CTERM system associated)